MSTTMDGPVISAGMFNASYMTRDIKHGYRSYINILPAYFAGKWWCFYLDNDAVREHSRIDPYKESINFFNAALEVSSDKQAHIFLSLQRFLSILEPTWQDVDIEEVEDSSTTYLPLMENVLNILSERGSFQHSLVDLEPSREEIIKLAMVRVAESYSRLEEVSAIYVSRYLDDITITILLQNAKYNRSQMDSLFEIEYALHELNPSLVMEFLYLPRLYEHRTDVIHPRAVLIYDRETNAIISGSPISGTA